MKEYLKFLVDHFKQNPPNLSMQDFEPIFDTVSDLCAEDQRLAFYEGLRKDFVMGVTLMIELAEK